MYDYALVFDGGSRGNPGPGYGSYQLTRVADGKQKIKRLEFGTHVTNNVAEYRALIAGLEDVAGMIKAAGKSPAEFSLDIRGDSKLVVEQVNGRWKVRDAGLQPWHAKAQALFRSFARESSLAWHDRSNSVRTLGH
jgi:ribonuclease HI